MELVTLLIGLLATIVFLLYVVLPKRRPKNFPPGPSRIPIFGNAPKYSPQNHEAIMALSQTHGPILGLQLGSYWMVILNDADDIRECMSKAELSGRSGYNAFYEENITQHTKGVVMSHGKIWHDMRRFSMRTLKDFGMGKRASMESIIMEEVQELMEVLKKDLGQPISTQNLFNASVLNIIWVIVAGERFKLDDERMKLLLYNIFEVFQTTFEGIKRFNFLFPLLADLGRKFPTLFGYTGLRETMTDFMKKAIREHRETIQLGSPRDFIDSFLEESLRAKETGDVTSVFLDDANDTALVTLLTDIFGAGSETTSTTLTWTFFLLALHPQVQQKLYEEIEAVAGTRPVCLEDRVKMPYSEAVMTEVYRFSSLAAFTIPHSPTEDVTFKGYRIPKDTIVFGNLYAAHYCPKTWGDPENFRPERFLSADGKIFQRHPHVLAFSVGKRQCLGETLARDEHFLFMNNMIQQLKVEMPKDEPKHSLKAVRGLVLTPEPHRLILIDRNARD